MGIAQTAEFRRMGQQSRFALGRALAEASYEVLPFKGTEEKVLAHVPKEVALTVTTTEAKGLAPTVDLACRLAAAGYQVSPHLAARLVRDRSHLADVVDQLDDSGINGAFCIAGDAAEPAGEFFDSLSLLEALEENGHRFASVGIGGYPEGHGSIEDALVARAIREKARHATYVVTQLCFDAQTTVEWARDTRASGVELPIRVGLPGAIGRQHLIRVSAGLGLGQSARFLKKQQSMFWRFFLPGGYSPDKLVQALAPSINSPDSLLAGLQIFTFNQLESTERWRQNWLDRLSWSPAITQETNDHD